MGRHRRTNEDRFVEKLFFLDNGCWGFDGWKDKDGYPMFNFRFEWDDELRDIRASHAALAIFEGVELPLETQACHICDHSFCVNPDHLFTGDQMDNIHDMVRKGRHTHGDEHYKAVLTEEIVRKMRILRTGGKSVASIARMFGFNKSTTGAAISGQNWKHVK